MTEFPQPNVRDGSALAKRMVIALIIGIAAAVVTWWLARAIIRPELEEPNRYREMSADGFVFWLTAAVASAIFMVAFAVMAALARREQRKQRIPRAEIR